MIIILFDGRCGLCQWSVKILRALDWLHHLQFENFHDTNVRETYASNIPLEQLNHEMHAVLSNGNIVKGFFAFRAIAWRVPLLWLLAPFLYLPGMPWMGKKAYGWIAQHRSTQ